MTELDASDADALTDGIRHALRATADPSRAAGQQAYMKSAMPFLGVRVPDARRIARGAITRETSPETLFAAASALWDDASHREERYAAMALLGAPAVRADERSVQLIEHMVRGGQWWDVTDELAHRVAELLDADPVRMAVLVREWSGDEDMWIRRLAIIAQLGRRDRLDADLLKDVIEANSDDREFFIRKAIGWALRDAARARPEWVRAFVASHDLRPLSVREALKRL